MANRTENHIIAAGTLASQAAIDAETALVDFALQSDMGQIRWAAPRSEGTTIPRPVAVRRAWDGSGTGVGLLQFQWAFDHWTLGQMDHWLDTVLTSGGVRLESADVSVRTYDDTDAPFYVTCKTIRPTGRPVPGGWENVIVPFDFGTEVTS